MDTTPDDCVKSHNGTSQGPNTSCADNLCESCGVACCIALNPFCECIEYEDADECTILDENNIPYPNKTCADLIDEEIYCCGSCCNQDDLTCLTDDCNNVSEWLCVDSGVYPNTIWNGCDDCACNEGCGADEFFDCGAFGICCMDETCFDVLNIDECDLMLGYFTGGMQCIDVEGTGFCDTGACCDPKMLPGEDCVDGTIQTQCEDYEWMRGTWVPPPSYCKDDVCDFGACCMKDGSCTEVIEKDCPAGTGIFKGLGTECGELCLCSGCDFPAHGDMCGSCCEPNSGICAGYMPYIACQMGWPGWEWIECQDWNDGYECSVDCYGACCYTCGGCYWQSQSDCNGDFRGCGVPCEPWPCYPHIGCCCTSSGPIGEMQQGECDAADGVWQGCGTNCNWPTCAGGCCINNTNYCEMRYQDYCDGTWSNFGTSCEFANCWGSCCHMDGECSYLCVQNANIDSCWASYHHWAFRKHCYSANCCVHCNPPSGCEVGDGHHCCGWSGCPCGSFAAPGGGIEDCPEECLNAGCDCYCLNTTNGIVCL